MEDVVNNKQKNLISIIMGIYNCADTLDEAIQSIIAQTYHDWQLIMCDDASSDHTYQVAEKYVKKYPGKFKLIKNQENMGLNYTLNHCLKYADGEYIARMDGDDISESKRLEKEVQFLKSHPDYAIVSTQMEYFDEEGIFGKSSGKCIPQLSDLIKGTPHCHAPCMVRREAYVQVGGYSIDKRLLRVEDYHLWIKMYAKGYRGYNLPEPLYRMRDDRNAMKRRKYRYRVNEAHVKYIALKKLKQPKWMIIYVLKPLIIGLLPISIYKKLHKYNLSR